MSEESVRRKAEFLDVAEAIGFYAAKIGRYCDALTTAYINDERDKVVVGLERLYLMMQEASMRQDELRRIVEVNKGSDE